MDIQTTLIYAGVLASCAAIVYITSVLGIREKTYDEAIAEQRQMPNEELLLARSSKDKNKDKKSKKAAGKKVKEKPAVERERSEKVDVPDAGNQHEKSHVEFEPDVEVVSDHLPQQEDVLMKTGAVKGNAKSEKVNNPKHNTAPKTEKIAAVKVDKASQQKTDKNVANKSEKVAGPKAEKPASKAEKIVAAKVDKTLVANAEQAPVEEPVMAASVVEAVESVPVVKEQRSKKKKSELATLQQMSGDRDGVNVSLIVPLVQKAELSRSEIQHLIDLLLNKQGSAVTNSEWIEGRQDPMVKLKKQLAEKEKALSDEQEAAQAVQSKLRELRAELNTDRSRWRQMEDATAAKHLEVQHLTTRLQHAQEAHKVDKANLAQQVQQLQAKLAEDHVVMRKLQEEQGVVKQEFHGQRQQMDLHIAHLTDQHQEVEGALKNQLNQLHGQLQEQENIIVSLRGEMQNARENVLGCDADNKMYREQVGHLTSEVRRQESLIQDLNRQLEEMHHLKSKLDHRITSGARLESQLQYECEALRKEVTTLKEAYAKLTEEKDGAAAKVKADRDDLLSTIGSLQADARKAGEESEKLVSQLSGLKKDSRQLKEENESLAALVTERPAAEGRENGDVAYPEEKPLATKEETSQLNSLLKQKEAEVEELSTQIINHKTEISKLNEDLEAQKKKNNDLRVRNWKAMDALSATEKSLETHLKESKNLISESSSAVRLEEQNSTKQLLERIFPDVAVPTCQTHAVWVEQFVKSADALLASLKSAPKSDDLSAKVAEQEKQIGQLQGVSAKYKAIIFDTEALLKQLQDSAEEEETKWSSKVQQRDAELASLREERDGLERSLEELGGTQQEQVRLQTDLKAAREKELEMSKEVTKLQALVQLGQESLTQEHRVSQDLQHQVDKLNGVSENHNSATNGGDTETSIPEGGSVKK